jgi:DNA invertase Pin-like site-specific DNA recombinase
MIPVQPAALQKITARHLQRQAMLYVRQSTLHQVLENTESTARQYALRERAIALGWPAEQIVVIDQDLGHSGASAADREGFQRLVAEVGLGHVGLVMGLEVSRLARSSLDWHHLLEICAMTGTLILDEDGLYDPATFNDRLLLGLKGTMSEAELHVLRARLRGGILNKAQRAALRLPLPMGLAYAEDETVILDPDAQIRASHWDAVRDLQTHRVGHCHGEVFSHKGAALSSPCSQRSARRRGPLGTAAAQHDAQSPAQSSLRRGILLWAHAHDETA